MNSSILFDRTGIPFPVHAVLISHRGELIQEDYQAPCSKDSLHRMFSVTKGFTALAVTALAAEGKLQLSDPIIRYFPDYTPANPHPWLAEMTIQDMMDMRTCHTSTTYKLNPEEHWVRSFFITPPSHRSGQIFKYDTGSAHILAELVKRISGLGVLDYLRRIYLDAIGFSSEAWILKDPFGTEMGGSGLLAHPRDIMVTARFLMDLYKGTWQTTYGYLIRSPYDTAFFERYRELFRQCVSFRSSTMHEGKTLDECQGYGSQFWMIRNGFMMYGMGGQYAAFYPQEDLIIVTAADAQPLQGGTQIILNEMNRIDSLLKDDGMHVAVSTPERPSCYGDAAALNRNLSRLAGSYRFLENAQGFISCRISPEEIVLVHKDASFRFPVSPDEAVMIVDPKYRQTLYVRSCALEEGGIYQYAQIYSEYLGSIRILLQGDGNRLTVYLRKIEEYVFAEMNGFLEAERE